MGYNTWYWASACFAADAPVTERGERTRRRGEERREDRGEKL
jgi:hypothetical protein